VKQYDLKCFLKVAKFDMLCRRCGSWFQAAGPECYCMKTHALQEFHLLEHSVQCNVWQRLLSFFFRGVGGYMGLYTVLELLVPKLNKTRIWHSHTISVGLASGHVILKNDIKTAHVLTAFARWQPTLR